MQTYGSDLHAALVGFRSEMSADAIVGVQTVDEGTDKLTSANPRVKECREFMRKNETRDALSVIFV
jgi:hypothetical protein